MRYIEVRDENGKFMARIEERKNGLSVNGPGAVLVYDILKTWNRRGNIAFKDIPARGSNLSRVIFGPVKGTKN